MTDKSTHNDLINRLLSDRDAEYRRANVAEQRLAELDDVENLRIAYERKLAEQEKSIHDKDNTIRQKEERISKLEQKLLYLERKMWGKMSEKRQIPDDPNQLTLDFDKLEMTKEEETIAKQAIEKIQEYK